MAPTTPTGVPAALFRGDTWKWKVSDEVDYPQSEGWTVKYSLTGIDVLPITAIWQTSGDDADSWLVSEVPANTKQIQAGVYRLRKYVTGSGSYAGEEYTLDETTVNVYGDHRTMKAGDDQTYAEYMKPILEASLKQIPSVEKFIETYGVAGRQVIRMPIEKRRAWLSSINSALHQKSTGSMGRKVRVAFK